MTNPKPNFKLLANIPAELRTPPLWLQFYNVVDPKRPDKKPSPHPCVKFKTPELRSANLRSLDHLMGRKAQDGFQRLVVKEEGFVFIDLDGVRNADTGEVEPEAQTIIDTLNSYTEVSKSGKGIHIVCRGKLDADLPPHPPSKVEIYSGITPNKIIAMTGDLYDPNGLLYTTVEDRREEVEQLLREQQAKSGSTAEVLNVLTERDVTKATDTDLPESCLDGWLGQICKERMSALPRAYAWLALLAGASVLVPRETKHRCNLYVDLDGPVHSGKSSAFEMAFHLLSLGKPALMKMKAGSAEGLAEYVGDVDGASRLLYPDELAHLLEKSMIERSSFSRFLTSAFYDDLQEMTVSKRKALTFNARLSLAGGTVEDQFGDLFGSATTGGLYDRFLFGKCPTGYQYLWQPLDDVHPADVVDRAVPVVLQPSVFEARNWWIKELGITPRVAELCVRAATICASFDGRATLTAEMLQPALELAKYQMRVRALLQPNPGENPDARMAFAIRNWLAEHASDGRWVGRRLLSRGVHAHRLGPKVFDGALRALEFNGEIESDKVGNKKFVVRLVAEEQVSPQNKVPIGDTCPPSVTATVTSALSEDVSSF
jgi:putative DNA primase/helicase